MQHNRTIHTITSLEPNFPPLLREIPSCPKNIFYLGTLTDQRCIAIVGTRKASTQGCQTAYAFAQTCAQQGWCVVSGLALGIDASAHQGALDAGGCTWAVVAGGVDRIYPQQHEQLATDIIESGGCILSEYAPKTPTYPNQFIARNRIISGLARAIVIIEAPHASGALTTARFAGEQGRDIFVVPGSISSENFIGSHALIRDGARLVTSMNDVWYDMGESPTETPSTPTNTSTEIDTYQQRIMEILRREKGASVDKLIAMTTLKTQNVQAALSALIIKGMVVQEGIAFKITVPSRTTRHHT